MAKKEKKKKKIIHKLRNKYRLVILNDESFEERFSLRLSRLNVFTLVAGSMILLIVLVILLVAFTPLREYIPGYTDVTLRKNYITLALKTDSLEQASKDKSAYIKSIRTILNGGTLPNNDSLNIVNDTNVNPKKIKYPHSKADSNLRDYVESAEKYNILFQSKYQHSDGIADYTFFAPLQGEITSSFNIKKSHFGVDIVAPKNAVIKATLAGTVVFAGWTSETGYMIEIQHNNNLISFYKHNSVLFKKAGDYVKAGEAISIIGNSGEYTTGPHLHFELWYNGSPVNPQNYIAFN